MENDVIMIEDTRKKKRLIIRIHLFFDVCLTVVSFVGAYFIRRDFLFNRVGDLDIEPNYYILLLMIIIIWVMCFIFYDIYSNFSEKDFYIIVKDVVKSSVTGMIILLFILYLIKMKDVSRILLGIFFVLDTGLLIVSKRIMQILLRRFELNQLNFHNILIIGSKRRAEGAIGIINSSNRGYTIIGCLDTNPNKIGKEVRDGVRIIGTLDDLKQLMLTTVIDEVLFAMPLKEIESVQVYMLLIEIIGVKVRIFPDWHIYSVLYQPSIASMHFDDFHGIPTMLLSATSSKHRDLLIKVSADYFIVLLAMLILLPFFLIIGAAIFIASPGSVFFKQERMGLNGRKFDVYKFRTMAPDAENQLEDLREQNEADGPAFKIDKDPRIIPFVGTFLRKSGLDELPQLINILKGEMSLIGPRPPIPSEVDEYNVWQRRRLSMKPGITCLWQICPNRNDISFNKWMEMDLKYIDNWSLWLDLKIFWKTVMVMFRGEGR